MQWLLTALASCLKYMFVQSDDEGAHSDSFAGAVADETREAKTGECLAVRGHQRVHERGD